ncbi:MAG: ROK family protein [Candidatus Nomurabacteria bacterium]|nr:MAG: ROK family protein [Candidatus Nomurabacteria bacterium]
MIVAVDTGGTKTLVTLFSSEGVAGKMIRFPTPKTKTDYLDMLRKTLRDNYGGQRVEAIVIGMPGIVQDNIVVWCNSLKWKNFDIVSELKGVLGSAPIFIENDANLGGLSETRSQAPVPTSSLYVTISTGIGTGITTNGKIDPGLRLSEGGRMLVEYEGEIREWESFASGRAIVKTYDRYARDIKDKKTWDEIADRISRGLLAAIPLLQTEVIIFGGSIGTYFSHYSNRLEDILQKHLPAHIPCPALLEAKHPEEAVIYGCYYYAVDTLDN